MKKAISILLAVAMLLSLCACSRNKRSVMTIRPSEFSKETQEVLDLFDDEIQFFDISLDETVKSYTISVWVYRDGTWNEDGKTYGKSDLLGNRIAIRLTETSCDIYNISENGSSRCSYPVLDTTFDKPMGVATTRMTQELPIELNKEIPICVKTGSSANQMTVMNITEDFRNAKCEAGIAVTLTVSDAVAE